MARHYTRSFSFVDPTETPNGSGLAIFSHDAGDHTLASLSTMPVQDLRVIWRQALGEDAPPKFKTSREQTAQSFLNRVTTRAVAPAPDRDTSSDPPLPEEAVVPVVSATPTEEKDVATKARAKATKPARTAGKKAERRERVAKADKPKPSPVSDAERKRKLAMPDNPRPGSAKAIFRDLFNKATARGRPPEDVREGLLDKMVEAGVGASTARTVITDYYTQVLGIRKHSAKE